MQGSTGNLKHTGIRHQRSAPGKIVGKDKLLEIDIGRLKVKHVLGKLNMYWEN
jgi:hypothetical protein